MWGRHDAAPYAAVHPGPAGSARRVWGVLRVARGGAPRADSPAYRAGPWSRGTVTVHVQGVVFVLPAWSVTVTVCA